MQCDFIPYVATKNLFTVRFEIGGNLKNGTTK
jgi:hypothetical protein